MVEVQKRLIDQLDIPQLRMVCGGSMGGMQALEWTLRFPGSVRKAWITASARAHNAMQIAFNEAARQAVMRDPLWKQGFYDDETPPNQGLSVARMIGHLSFLSGAAFERKFGRGLQEKDKFDFHHGIEFQVESYLSYQGDKFTKRFDANSFLYLTKAIDYYERSSLAGSSSEYLFTSFTSDWIYPSGQSKELHALALDARCKSEWHDIDLPMGHDAFLLDGEKQGELVSEFLA
jgi:homoserine O-acetyltransferase